MSVELLNAELSREHREIDAGISGFVTSAALGKPDVAPLRKALTLLRRHIYLEEEVLFPPLRGGGLTAVIFVMLRDHGEIWATIADVEASLDAGDTAAASATAEKLFAMLAKHNGKEEPTMYAQMDAALPAEASAKLLDAIDNSVAPDGWKCARASGASQNPFR